MPPEFVGRSPQIDAALDCLRRAGTLRIVCVLGEAGIGKSRFASHVVECAEALDLKCAWGGCSEQPGVAWLWPFRQLGRRLEALTGSDVLVRIGGTSWLIPESSEARAEWLLSIADALAAVGRDQELCLVLDDLQWADLGTLTLIELLVQQRAPLGLVLAWREQDAARNSVVAQPLERVRRAGITVALEGFELQEVAQFFETLGHPLSVDMARAVRDMTGGNPFFLSEVGRSWRSAPPHCQLTEGVRAQVQRRIQLLSPECRSLIECASVVGRDFDGPALIACTQSEPGVIAAALAEGLRHGFLINPSQGHGEPGETAPTAHQRDPITSEFRFLHDLTRESVYEGLSKERRAALHRAWAESWIRMGEVDRHAGRIFEHLMLASAEARVLGEWARLAAEAHLGHQDCEAAISVVERSLVVLDKALGQSPELARLVVLRAKATLLSGDSERGILLCKQAAALARSQGYAVALGEAALAWGLETRFSQIDAEHVSLLEEALAKVEPGERELRIRLTARLAAALQPGRDPSGVAHCPTRAVHPRSRVRGRQAWRSSSHRGRRVSPTRP